MSSKSRFTLHPIFVVLCCALFAVSAFAQTTLTINNGTGLINVPVGITPNFAALNVGGVSLALPAGGLVGTTASQALTNKTYNGLAINGNGGSLTVASSKYLIVNNQLVLAGNDGSTVSFGAGGTVAYTTGSYADPSWITSLSASKLTGTVTATNGVVTTGNYSNPTWITSLAASKIVGVLPVANGGTGMTTLPSIVNGANIGVTGSWPNQTISVNGLHATDIGYTRSGSGMAARTVGAELDEMPLTTRGAGGAVDGKTDDTTALQRQLDSKSRVSLSQGTIKITNSLSLSTVGQIVQGNGIPNSIGQGTQILQTVSGQDGIHWYAASDMLPDQGGHTDFVNLRDFSVRTNFSNTGIGLDLGRDPTYSGDYMSLSNLYIEHFQTGIHVQSMGLSRWWNVAIDGDSATPSAYGVKFDGGSNNSHILAGVNIANCNIGLDLNTPGQGNVYLLGDLGSNATHVKEESDAANGVFIGGNFEQYTSRIFDLHGNSNNVIIEPGYNLNGAQTNEPYLLNGNKLIFVGHTGAFGATGAVMQFKGEGHVVLNPNVTVNTQGDSIDRVWVQGVFPAVGDNSLPPPSASNFLGIYMVVPRAAANGPADLAFVNQRPDGTYFMDSLCASSVLNGINTFTGAQTYNGALSYTSSLTGTGMSTMTIDSASAAPLSLRNTGSYYALIIRDQVTNADVAGFSNTGTCVGQRFYSPAGGNAQAGAFQTNNFSLHDTDTPHQMGVAVNGADAALVDPTGVTVHGVFHLPPITRPASAAEGDIYVDSSDHHTYEYNGTTWVTLDK